ncbi:hypothetical protein Tco_0849678 [Tanacetum coccineum]
MKQEVSMAIPMKDGSGYTKEVISVEYEWKPPHSVECKIFGHTHDACPKRIRELDIAAMDKPKDGFTKVSSRKKKGKKVDINQPKTRPISGILHTKPKPSFYRHVSKHDTNKSGADLDPKVQVEADDSKKASDTYTLNSFDVLNNVDVGDECGVFSSMGTQEAGHATTSKHRSSKWYDESESDVEVDEVLFPEEDKFDIRLVDKI